MAVLSSLLQPRGDVLLSASAGPASFGFRSSRQLSASPRLILGLILDG